MKSSINVRNIHVLSYSSYYCSESHIKLHKLVTPTTFGDTCQEYFESHCATFAEHTLVL